MNEADGRLHSALAQSDVEWLRCLTISRRLTPILPESVRRRLSDALLIEERVGQQIVTSRGGEVLRLR